MSSSKSSTTTPEDGSQPENDGKIEHEYEWMDEKCLNPIRSVPGCSRLCDACLWIFQQSPVQMRDQHLVYRSHLRHLATLIQSTLQGCLLCSRLLSVVAPRVCPCHLDHDSMAAINLRYYRDTDPFGGPIGRLWFTSERGIIMCFNFFCPIRKLLYKSGSLRSNHVL